MITTITAVDSQTQNFADDNSMEFNEFEINTNETKSNLSLTDIFSEELANVLNIYLTPVLIFLGSIGNLVSIIVFCNTKLRGQSTSQYLTALAISDSLFLFQLIPPWLNAVHASMVFSDYGFCQAFVYMSYVSSSHSSWLVVAFTVERFVAVLYPLRRTRMCTVRRARIIIVLIAAASLLVNVPVLRFAVPSTDDCNIDRDLMEHAARFNLVDTIFSFTLPLGIIIVLNIWIVIGVYRLSRDRGTLMREENVQTRARGRLATPHRRAAAAVAAAGASERRRHVRRARGSLQRSQQRITRMLLIVSSVFVVLNMPAYAMRIMAYANNMNSFEYSGKWAALQQICLLFFYANFGINFLLYCVTGQNFRRALLQTFPWLRWLKGCCCTAGDQDRLFRLSVTNSASINTDATTNNAAAAAQALNTNNDSQRSRRRCRRRRGQHYVRRWRFDNSRQQRPNVNIEHNGNYEMEDLSVQRGSPPPYERQDPFRVNPTGPVQFGPPPVMINPMTLRPVPIRPRPGLSQSLPGISHSTSDTSNDDLSISRSLQRLPENGYSVSQSQSLLRLEGHRPSPSVTRPSRPVYAHSDTDSLSREPTPTKHTDFSPTCTDSDNACSTTRECIDSTVACDYSSYNHRYSHSSDINTSVACVDTGRENSCDDFCSELLLYLPVTQETFTPDRMCYPPPYENMQVPVHENLTPSPRHNFNMPICESFTPPPGECFHLQYHDSVTPPQRTSINRNVGESLYGIHFNQPVRRSNTYGERFNRLLPSNVSFAQPRSENFSQTIEEEFIQPRSDSFSLPRRQSFTPPASEGDTITNVILPTAHTLNPASQVGFVSYQDIAANTRASHASASSQGARVRLAGHNRRSATHPPQRPTWIRSRDPHDTTT